MEKLYPLLLLFIGLALSLDTNAQDFKAKQNSQEKTIRAAFKAHKITDNEYEKLMQEQEIIKQTIEKYLADRYLTPHEKNVIYGKLVRAEKRLRHYKTNLEVQGG